MNLKGIIFDFGFTLFYFKNPSVKNYFECFQRGLRKTVFILKKQGFLTEKTENGFIKQFNKQRSLFWKESLKTKKEFLTSYIFKKVLRGFLPPGMFLALERQGEGFFEHLADVFHSAEEEEWKPFEHTRETLQRLKGMGFKIAVLSNHPHHGTIINLLRTFNLFELFDAVVTSAEFGRRKPDPEIFLYTLKKMGLNEDVISDWFVCGDEYADVMGGYRAGFKTVLCERDVRFPFEKDIDVPEMIKIRKISELLPLLSRF